jgi:hypothetical protein
MADRVRIQNVGLSTVLLGQGVPFMHAGSDLLRSKSLDRDSFNSGDWFNKLDFTYGSNNFGVGLPVAGKNQDSWTVMQPFLADPALKPEREEIVRSADLFRELLLMRYSSDLFRLETADEIQARVAFHNTGPDQLPGLIVMTLSDLVEPDLDPAYELLAVLINANDEAQTITLPDLAGIDLLPHPVQVTSVDDLVKMASFDMETGAFNVPGRTAAVFVAEVPPQERIDGLAQEVEALVDAGALAGFRGDTLILQLDQALWLLEQGLLGSALEALDLFVRQVNYFVDQGTLAPEEGQSLVEEGQGIIKQIQARNQDQPWTYRRTMLIGK